MRNSDVYFNSLSESILLGLVDTTSCFISSISRLNFALLFWNHVITCAHERPSFAAISSLSLGVRYFCKINLFSSSYICWLVKAVRVFRFFFGICDLPCSSSSLFLRSSENKSKILLEQLSEILHLNKDCETHDYINLQHIWIWYIATLGNFHTKWTWYAIILHRSFLKGFLFVRIWKLFRSTYLNV